MSEEGALTMEERTIFPIPQSEQPTGERFTRDEPPTHYTFKIESFSQLTEILAISKIDNYESGEFKVGGYKWKLSLYPDGDKKRNATGHISLYLVLAESNKLQLGFEVNAFFRLFVYDQVRDKYFTYQCGNDKPRPFRATKNEHGFPKLLSLSTFNDVANGYLSDDCCIFGAEVFVTNCTGKGESFSVIKDPQSEYFTWKVRKFSKIKHYIRSEVFTVGGLKWSLQLYPHGDEGKKGENLCLFIHFEDYIVVGPGKRIYADFKLRVKDQVSGNHCERTGHGWFHAEKDKSVGLGFRDLLPPSHLTNKSKGFIVNDTLIVEAKFIRLSMVKNFS